MSKDVNKSILSILHSSNCATSHLLEKNSRYLSNFVTSLILKTTIFWFIYLHLLFKVKLSIISLCSYVNLSIHTLRLATNVNLGILEMSYRFQTKHVDSRNNLVQFRKCSNSIVVSRRIHVNLKHADF